MRLSVEETKAYNAAYYKANRERRLIQIRTWNESNPEKRREIVNGSNRRNSGAVLAKTRRYQLAKDQRVPSWADIEKIKAIYREAERTGMTVDHIIPLRGQLVSGLHVENNLQLLPGSVNYSKGNKFDMENLF